MKSHSLIQVTCLGLLALQQLTISVSAVRFPEGPNPFNLVARNSSHKLRNEFSSSREEKSLIRGEQIRGGAKKRVPKTINKDKIHLTPGQYQTFNLLSGGVAGTVSSCFTNPLEVIKTQLQSTSASKTAHGDLAAAGGHPIDIAKRVLAQDGIGGFWRGMRPTLVGIIPARSVYFYSYQKTKKALGKLHIPEGSIGNALVSGFAAGIASNTLTNPIWMVKTRMQLLADSSAGQKAYANYGDVIQSIWKEEGIGGFYKGIFASYWGCAEGCIQFILYEQIKSKLIAKQNEKRAEIGLSPTSELPKLTYFFSAAFSKGMAAVATYPHEVARTRLREQARGGVFKYHGMWQTLGLIAKEEGRQGLYAGMGVHLMKVVPNSAIMFLTYEVVNTWLSKVAVIDQ